MMVFHQHASADFMFRLHNGLRDLFHVVAREDQRHHHAGEYGTLGYGNNGKHIREYVPRHDKLIDVTVAVFLTHGGSSSFMQKIVFYYRFGPLRRIYSRGKALSLSSLEIINVFHHEFPGGPFTHGKNIRTLGGYGKKFLFLFEQGQRYLFPRRFHHHGGDRRAQRLFRHDGKTCRGEG